MAQLQLSNTALLPIEFISRSFHLFSIVDLKWVSLRGVGIVVDDSEISFMASFNQMAAALVHASQENTVALANVKFDFAIIKCEPPA